MCFFQGPNAAFFGRKTTSLSRRESSRKYLILLSFSSYARGRYEVYLPAVLTTLSNRVFDSIQTTLYMPVFIGFQHRALDRSTMLWHHKR